MPLVNTEYMLKGVFLGLLLAAALRATDAARALGAACLLLSGLLAAIAFAWIRQRGMGLRVRGRFLVYLLFLCLESSQLVYIGIFAGAAAAALWTRGAQEDGYLLLALSTGGAVAGALLGLLPRVKDRWTRSGVSLVIALAGIAVAMLWLGQWDDLAKLVGWQALLAGGVQPIWAGLVLLAGTPFYYLLTFAGHEEETEVEVGVACGLVGLGLALVTSGRVGAQLPAFLLPVMLYFWYTLKVLGKLRIFKHSIRGFTYADAGKPRQAILAFRRAMQLDPENSLAKEGLWKVHRQLDIDKLAGDAETLSVVDFDLCLERAGTLLLHSKPSADRLQEAHRLLDLVSSQRKDLGAIVHYWRAVARTHEKQFDQAAMDLTTVLDPSWDAAGAAARQSILMPAWRLALTSHPELKRRVGQPQLALPGRRMEAIAAVDGGLAESPQDSDLWGLKRVLYHELTEASYNEAAASGKAAPTCDHAYLQQLGLALITDPARWQRGAEYLRMAARGLPELGPTICTQLAQAYERAGDERQALASYEEGKRLGHSVGPKQLSGDEKQAYFAIVKLLADRALARDDVDAAIGNLQLFTESDRSGVETLRALAGLFEKKGDAWGALRVTEKALLYNAKDPDLLERKDRYYYSVLPADLAARKDQAGGFDTAYCVSKAKTLLDGKQWDANTVDWAEHLAELARVMQPDAFLPRVLAARCLLRRGERDQAIPLLEQVRTPRPEKFASAEDEDAWYTSCRLLGEIYLYELSRADLAIDCFQSYRKCSKSGADTLFKLGQAYEAAGDRAKAVQSYKHVVSYEQHPLAPEARDALYRLQAS